MATTDPKPTLMSRVVGTTLGTMFAPVFGLASFVRRKRAVHPYGGGYEVSITVSFACRTDSGVGPARTMFAGSPCASSTTTDCSSRTS
jgi:hypothetical protein